MNTAPPLPNPPVGRVADDCAFRGGQSSDCRTMRGLLTRPLRGADAPVFVTFGV